ncbi:tetratricopeptide repeat protein [Chryseobacterium shigense]|uniref:Tetratricopeptide (TPR) repeat protein n=1 Tax=Chryseobacterium shigense TaxID=297244 RepID=A0A841NCF9_9FLAO|nr:tetratricopeptide repeat protein [Chryseobacterium shigense]MBB6369039.1 tetratricopeptide (TPR) repeat protein [Chryseobacterium shigense]
MKYLIFFFLFYSITAISQQKTTQDIDNWLESTTMLYAQGKPEEYIKENTAIIEASRKINYSKGIATGNVRLAIVSSFNKEYKKSMAYLDIAEKEKYTSTDYELQSTILREFGNIYLSLGLFQEAIEQYRKMKATALKIKDEDSRVFSVSASQNNMGDVYNELKQIDSAAVYYMNAYKNINTLKNKNVKLNALLNIVTLSVVNSKFAQSKMDSATYYLQKYESYNKDSKSEFNQYTATRLTGEINFAKKEYDIAVDNYKKAMQLPVAKKTPDMLRDLYRLLYETYSKTAKQDSAQKYLTKYTILNDSISRVEKSNIAAPINKLIEQNEKPLKSEKRSLLYWSLAALLILFTVLIILRYRHQKEKGKIISNIVIKEKETAELKQQLNTAFDEVVELAKNNSPSFLARFQEVYPNIIKKLLQIDPQLKTSELKFCALLFLNFSSKDIAEYTFVQHQSIQTRKNRLRKKLNIPTEEDIYLWFKNLDN